MIYTDRASKEATRLQAEGNALDTHRPDVCPCACLCMHQSICACACVRVACVSMCVPRVCVCMGTFKHAWVHSWVRHSAGLRRTHTHVPSCAHSALQLVFAYELLYETWQSIDVLIVFTLFAYCEWPTHFAMLLYRMAPMWRGTAHAWTVAVVFWVSTHTRTHAQHCSPRGNTHTHECMHTWLPAHAHVSIHTHTR